MRYMGVASPLWLALSWLRAVTSKRVTPRPVPDVPLFDHEKCPDPATVHYQIVDMRFSRSCGGLGSQALD